MKLRDFSGDGPFSGILAAFLEPQIMKLQHRRVPGQGDDPVADLDTVPALDILSQITASLASENDLEALLEQFLGTIVILAGAGAGAVRVLTNSGLEMRLVGSVGLPEEVLKREQMVRYDCGTCGQALRDDDIHQATELNICTRQTKSDYFGRRCSQVVAVPLKYKGRILGVYNLFMDVEREFAPELLGLLRAIGELLGIALENDRLSRDNMRMSLMNERQMMANEVHDSLAQTLVYMKTRVSLLRDAIVEHDESRASKYLDDLDRELGNAHVSLRDLLTHFRNRMDPEGLLHALQGIADDFYDRTGVFLDFTNYVPDLNLRVEQEVQVFHIVQEALANIGRHAHALRARLILDKKGGFYEVTIQDDGGGMPLTQSASGAGVRAQPGHFGMSIMQERAKRLGGEITVGTTAGQGTLVRLSFPASGGRSEVAA
jgi:two-component system nitrate/nitrite sensor histidine kinase NarX